MPHHHERRHLPHSADQMYNLVADVARYPEFLPWVSAIRIRKDEEGEMLADMIVGFKSRWPHEAFAQRLDI
jgi:coenzyme Q-binding protein COQ10